MNELTNALTVLGTQAGQAHVQDLIKSTALQNPTGGTSNAVTVREMLVKWALEQADNEAHLLKQIPFLGDALETVVLGLIHSDEAEKFLTAQIDALIAVIYRVLKMNGLISKVLGL